MCPSPSPPQLIQDEIKALVQLQNRQASVQPHADFSPTPVTKTSPDTKDYIFPLISTDCVLPKNVPSDSDSLAAPAHTPSFSSPSPPLHRSSETANQGEERATTVLSSGYGTLSAWDTGLEPAMSPGEDEDSSQGREKHHWSSTFQENTETTVMGCQQGFSEERTLGVEELNPVVYQQKISGYVCMCGWKSPGLDSDLISFVSKDSYFCSLPSCVSSTSQPLTSWAQRQKLRPKKSKAGPASSPAPEYQELPRSSRQDPLESTDSQEQVGQGQCLKTVQ